MDKNKRYISIGILVFLLATVGMFFAGMSYQKSKAADNPPQNPGQQFMRGGGQGGGSGGQGSGGSGQRGSGQGFTAGEILSKDDQSITVKLRDGGSQTIYYSNTTTIAKSDAGSASDLKSGEQVMVSGSGNPDGSLAAQNIQIRPAGAPGSGFGPPGQQ